MAIVVIALTGLLLLGAIAVGLILALDKFGVAGRLASSLPAWSPPWYRSTQYYRVFGLVIALGAAVGVGILTSAMFRG